MSGYSEVSQVFVISGVFFSTWILYLLRLTRSHTGAYLAECVADCLDRFGLKDKVSYLNPSYISQL